MSNSKSFRTSFDAKFARGGGVQLTAQDDFKPATARSAAKDKFLEEPDRFTGRLNHSENSSTDEAWAKPAGVGHGDPKSEMPVKSK